MLWPGHNYINERAFRKLSCSNDPKIVEGRRGGDINLRLAHILAAFGTRNDWFPQRTKWRGNKKKKQYNREKWSYAVMWIVSRLKIYADWSTPMPFSRQFTMLGPRGSTAIGRVIIANYKLFVENEISVFLKWNAQNSRLRYLKRKRNENVG